MITFNIHTKITAPGFSFKILAKKAGVALDTSLKKHPPYEATLVLTTNSLSHDLNKTYRGKDKPTNVLSFPQFTPKELGRLNRAAAKNAPVYIGDIVLCLPIIRAEAKQQKKPLKHHLMHLIVHGTLHLLGYDHMNNREARTMEQLETVILEGLDIPDPYEDREPAPNRKKTKRSRIKDKA